MPFGLCQTKNCGTHRQDRGLSGFASHEKTVLLFDRKVETRAVANEYGFGPGLGGRTRRAAVWQRDGRRAVAMRDVVVQPAHR